MIDIYLEPLFLLFPIASLLIGTTAFLVVAVPLGLLSVLDPPRLRRYRLQPHVRTTARAFRQSLRQLAVNLTFMMVVAVVLWPALRLSGVHAGPLPHWTEMIWQLALFVVLDDVAFYLVHRALHTRWLYRHIHAVHHRITAPSAAAGGYFHPLEYAAINLAALSGPLLLGPHVATLWAWAVLRQWLAAEGHCGYALPLSPSRVLPGYAGSAYHDLHHRLGRGNYANYLRHLDLWFGTFVIDERAPAARKPA